MAKALGRCYKLLSSQAICTHHQVLNVAQECTVYLTQEMQSSMLSLPRRLALGTFSVERNGIISLYISFCSSSILQLNTTFLKSLSFSFLHFPSFEMPLPPPCISTFSLFLKGKKNEWEKLRLIDSPTTFHCDSPSSDHLFFIFPFSGSVLSVISLE